MRNIAEIRILLDKTEETTGRYWDSDRNKETRNDALAAIDNTLYAISVLSGNRTAIA